VTSHHLQALPLPVTGLAQAVRLSTAPRACPDLCHGNPLHVELQASNALFFCQPPRYPPRAELSLSRLIAYTLGTVLREATRIL